MSHLQPVSGTEYADRPEYEVGYTFRLYGKYKRGYAILENFTRNSIEIEKYLYAVYTDYKLAVSLVDRFSQLQAERVRRYNEENGTSFDVSCLCQLHDKKG